MANIRWVGRAQAVAQVSTVTMSGTWSGGETVSVEINDKTLTITIGSLVTNAQVATTLKEAWEDETLTDTTASFNTADGGQSLAEFAEITATVSGAVVTLRHDTPGVPFTMTVTDDSGTGTAAGATLTSATGPNFWDNIDNWSGGVVPGAADDVYFDNSDVSVLYALDQPSGTLTSLTIGSSFTGTIGLPKQNAGGYVEYRDDYLQVDATTVTIGRGEGSGSGRIKIDAGALVQTAVKVESTGTPIEFGIPAVLWKGTHASNTVDVTDGSFGASVFGGESAAIATLRNTNGEVYLGKGCTLTTVNNQSGTVEMYDNLTTLTSAGGTVRVGDNATIGTLTVSGGICDLRTSGTTTAATIGGAAGATLECANANVARTITTLTLKPGGTVNDPAASLTLTNDVKLDADVRSYSAT